MKTLQSALTAVAAIAWVAGVVGSAHAQVFVTDNRGSAGVSEYSFSGTFLRTFVPGGSGGLTAPNNLRFGPDGNLYVASGDGAIKKYDGTTGVFLSNVITGLGVVDDVNFDSDGFMYVPDYSTNAAYKIDTLTGSILKTYTGGLSHPEGLAFLPNGNFVVGSGNGANPVVFDKVTGVGTVFATGASVNVGVTAGPDNRMYFSRYSSGDIVVAPASGGAVAGFSSGGSLAQPQYMAFGNGSLYVGSINNNTVQFFNATTGAFQGSFSSPAATGIAIRSGTSAAAAPEPISLSLALIGALPTLALARRRRQRIG